jgi:serine/threonine protein kinase
VLLGEGGFGSVYRGKLYGNGEPVAIKCIPLDAKRAERAEEKIRAEADILKGCRSDFIVDFRGMCMVGGEAMIVMALMEGGSLYQALEDERINWWGSL